MVSNSPTRQSWLAIEPLDFSCLHFPFVGMVNVHHHIGHFHLGSDSFSLGSDACMVNTLSTEVSSQPQFFSCFVCLLYGLGQCPPKFSLLKA